MSDLLQKIKAAKKEAVIIEKDLREVYLSLLNLRGDIKPFVHVSDTYNYQQLKQLKPNEH
jgi:hypothetical protein